MSLSAVMFEDLGMSLLETIVAIGVMLRDSQTVMLLLRAVASCIACFACTGLTLCGLAFSRRRSIQDVRSLVRPWFSRPAWGCYIDEWGEYVKSLFVTCFWCPVVLRASSSSMVAMYAENVDWSHVEYTTDAFPFLCEALMQDTLGSRIGLFKSNEGPPLKIAIVAKSEPALTFARHELTGTAVPIISTQHRETEVPITPCLRSSSITSMPTTPAFLRASISSTNPPTPAMLPAAAMTPGSSGRGGRRDFTTPPHGPRSGFAGGSIRNDSMALVGFSLSATSYPNNTSFASVGAASTTTQRSNRDGARLEREPWDKLATPVMQSASASLVSPPCVSPSTSAVSPTMLPRSHRPASVGWKVDDLSDVPRRSSGESMDASPAKKISVTKPKTPDMRASKPNDTEFPASPGARLSPSPWQQWFKSVVTPASKLPPKTWWWQRSSRKTSREKSTRSTSSKAASADASAPKMTVFTPSLRECEFTSASFGIVSAPMWGASEKKSSPTANGTADSNGQTCNVSGRRFMRPSPLAAGASTSSTPDSNSTPSEMPSPLAQASPSQPRDGSPNMAPLVSFPDLELQDAAGSSTTATSEAFITTLQKSAAVALSPSTACLLHEVERRMKLLLPTLSAEGTLFGFVALPSSFLTTVRSATSWTSSNAVDGSTAPHTTDNNGNDKKETSEPTVLSQSELVQEMLHDIFARNFERVKFKVEGRVLMVSGSLQKH